MRREPPVPEYSGCSPAQIFCLLSGGENSFQLGEEPSRIWCSPEPQLSPSALALLFPSPVPASPFRPLFPWAPASVQALQLPLPLCPLSIPHGMCAGSLLPNMASPWSALLLRMPTPTTPPAHSGPRSLCPDHSVCLFMLGFSPEGSSFSPLLPLRVPPTPSTLFPSLSSHPAKELCSQAAWFSCQLCPLLLCAVGRVISEPLLTCEYVGMDSTLSPEVHGTGE